MMPLPKVIALAIIATSCTIVALFSEYPAWALFFGPFALLFLSIWLYIVHKDRSDLAKAQARAAALLQQQSNPLLQLPPMQPKGNNGRLSVPPRLP